MADITVKVFEARNLADVDVIGSNDPYVVVKVLDSSGKEKYKEKTDPIKKAGANPKFNFTKRIPANVILNADLLQIEVWDWDRFTSNDLLGQTSWQISQLTKAEVNGWQSLKDKKNKKASGEIRVLIKQQGGYSSGSPKKGYTTQSTSYTTQSSGYGGGGGGYGGGYGKQGSSKSYKHYGTRNSQKKHVRRKSRVGPVSTPKTRTRRRSVKRKSPKAYKAKLDASKSTAQGPGLQGHKRGTGNSYFNIFFMDSSGKAVSDVPLKDIRITITGPNGRGVGYQMRSKMGTDGSKSTHYVSYSPLQSGDYSINVTLAGESIKGMPCKVSVKDPAKACKSTWVDFTSNIESNTQNGLLKEEGKSFTANCTGAYGKQETVNIDDKGNGYYQVRYSLEGDHLFIIGVRDTSNPVSRFMGYNGEIPMQTSDLFFALRSALSTNDFQRFPVQFRGKEHIFFCPRLVTSEKNPGQRWCVGLCGNMSPDAPNDFTNLNEFLAYNVDVNGRISGHPTCKFTVKGPSGDNLAFNMAYDQDGRWVYSGQPNVFPPGEYEVVVVNNDRKLRPIKCETNNVAHPMQCYVDGPRLGDLKVYFRDSYGQPADGICTVTIQGPDGSVDVKVEAVDKGVYQATYPSLSSSPGEYTILVMVDSYPIGKYFVDTKSYSGEPEFVNLPSVDQSYVMEPSLEEFSLFMNGVDKKPTSSPCEVPLSGPCGPVDVTFKTPVSYSSPPEGNDVIKVELSTPISQGQYKPLNAPGNYSMPIIVGDDTFAEYTINTTNGTGFQSVPDPSNCFIKSPEPDNFTLYVRGYDGQPTDGTCTAVLTGSKGPVPVPFEQKGVGTYYGSYPNLNNAPDEDYVLEVFVDSQPVSKFAIKAVPNSTDLEVFPMANIRECYAGKPDLQGFEVFARDHKGQPTTGVCSVDVMGPDGPVKAVVDDKGDSTYSVSFKDPLNKVGGQYWIKVQIDDEDVGKFGVTTKKDSPDYEVWSLPDVSQCSVKEGGPGLKTFTFYVRGYDGQPVQPTKSTCLMNLNGPKGPIDVKVVDDGNGQYTMEYPALNDTPGEYTMVVLVDGEPAAKYRVTSDKDGIKSVENIANPNFSSPDDVDFQNFFIHPRGYDGRPTDGNCTMEMQGPDGQLVPFDVENNDYGTFFFKYNPLNQAPGDYIMNVMVDSKQPVVSDKVRAKVRNGSDDVEVISLPKPDECSIMWSPNLTEEQQIFVRGHDGKPTTDGRVTVQINGPDGPVTVNVNDDQPTAVASYAPLDSGPEGDYLMTTMVNGEPVGKFRATSKKNCPVKFKPLPNPKRCYVEGPGKDKLTVYVRDFEGLPTEGTVLVQISGPDGVQNPATSKPKEDSPGTYEVTYNPLDSSPGKHFMNVLVNNEPVVQYIIDTNSYGIEKVSNVPDDKECLTKAPESTEFMIYGRGYDRNPGDGGVCTFLVKGNPEKPLETKVEDQGDGVFKVTYDDLNSNPDTYIMTALIDSKPVAKYSVESGSQPGYGSDQPGYGSDQPGYGSNKPKVKRLPNPENCFALEPLTEEFVIHSQGYDGLPVNDSTCIVEIRGPDGESVETKVEDQGDGTFVVKYPQCKKKGDKDTYVFTAFIDFEPVARFRASTKDVPSSQFLKVVPMAKPENCFVQEPTPEEFVIQPRDFNGQPTEGVCTIEIRGPDGEPVDFKMVPGDDGNYVFKYDSLNDKPGDYVIFAMVDDQPVASFSATSKGGDSPLEVRRLPKSDKCFGKTPTPEEFTICLFSDDGRPTDGVVTFQIQGPDGPVDVKTNKCDDGTYKASYPRLTDTPGDYVLTAFVDGKPVSKYCVEAGPDKITKIESGANPEDCFVQEPSQEEFMVHVNDYNGQYPDNPDIEVLIVGPDGKPVEGTEVKQSPTGDPGTYDVKYPALNSKPGDYTVTVLVDSEPVGKFSATSKKNEPELTVKHLPNPDKCSGREPKMEEFDVLLKDYGGQPTSGDPVVYIQGPDGSVPVEIKETDDGVYTAYYEPLNKKPGDYVITAMVDDEPVVKYLVTSEEGDGYAPSDKLAVKPLPNPKKCFVDEPTVEEIQVFVRDYDEKPTDGTTSVQLIGPDGGLLPVNMDGESPYGTSPVKFEEKLNKNPGSYVMTTNVDGVPVEKFLVKSNDYSEDVKVYRLPNPDNCVVKDPCMEEFTVQMRGYDGQPTDEGTPFVTIFGPDGQPRKVEMVKGPNGVYTAKYDPLKDVPGEYYVVAMVNNQPVARFLVTSDDTDELVVKKLPKTDKCSAGLPSMEEMPVRVVDHNGQPTDGTVTVFIDGPEGLTPVQVEPVYGTDGLFTAKYSPLKDIPGDYDIVVMVDGEPVAKFKVKSDGTDKLDVKKMPNPENCQADRPGNKEMPIQICDYDKQPTSDSAPTVFIMGPDGPVEVTMEEGPNGQYTAKYEPLFDKPGDYTFTVVVDGQPVDKFDVTSKDDKLDVKRRPNPENCTSDTPTTDKFIIRVQDFGQQPSDAPVFVTIDGPNGPVKVKMVKDPDQPGVYYGEYNPFKDGPDGDYIVTAYVDGQPVGKYVVKSDGDKSPVKKLPSATKCMTNTPGMEETPVVVRGYDGEPTDGDVTVVMIGPNDYSVPVQVIPDEDKPGMSTLKYKPLKDMPGDYTMTVFVDGEPVSKYNVTSDDYSPTLKVFKVVSPENCETFEPTNRDFKILLKDFNGQPVTNDKNPKKPNTVVTVMGPDGPVPVKLVEDENGFLVATFDRPLNETPGKYTITALVDGQPVGKYTVTTEDGTDKMTTFPAPNPQDCVFPAPGMDSFPIFINDYNGNPVEYPKPTDDYGKPTDSGKPTDNIVVRIIGPDGQPIDVIVEEGDDGILYAKYDPLKDKPGDYVFTTIVDGEPVGKYVVTSEDGSDDLPFKTLPCDRKCFVPAPDQEELPIQVRDYGGQPTDGNVIVYINGPDGPIPVEIKDNSDKPGDKKPGDKVATYRPLKDVPGDYTVTAMVDGKPVSKYIVTSNPDDDKLKVKPCANPQDCQAIEPGMKRFPILIRDYDGSPTDGKVTVEMIGPDGEPITVDVEEGPDGMYYANYSPLKDKPGDYKVTTFVDGQPVGKYVVTSDGTDKLQVKPVASPETCTFPAPGMDKFPIYITDYGGRPTDGEVTVTIIGPDGEEIEVNVVKGPDGNYYAEYAPLKDKPGDYIITTMIDGQPLGKYTVTSDGTDNLKVRPDVDPEHCVIMEPSMDKFPIYIKGYDGQPTDCKVEVTIIGPDGEEIEVKLEEGPDGLYYANYAPFKNKPGDYIVTTIVDGKPVQRYQVTSDGTDKLHIQEPVEYDESKPQAPGDNEWLIKIDDMEEGGVCTVTIVDSDGQPIEVEVEEVGDGLYRVKYDKMKPGDYTMTANVDGHPVKKMLVSYSPGSDAPDCKNVASPEKCKLDDPGNEDMIIELLDCDGNPLEGVVTCVMQGPNGPVEVTVEEIKDDEGNPTGKYRAVWDAPLNEDPGDYILTASVDGNPIGKYNIQSSPDSDQPQVKKCANPKLCYVEGPNNEGLTVHTLDYSGQPTDSVVIVNVTGPKGPEPVKVDEEEPGKHSVTYSPLSEEPGDYTISIIVDGEPIEKYEVTTTEYSDDLVTRNAPDIEQCFLKGPKPKFLMFFVRDFHGQPTKGTCTLDMEGPKGPVPVTITEVSDGTYRAQYPPLDQTPGDYVMEAMIDGQPVGSFVVTSSEDDPIVVKNSVDPQHCFIMGPGMEELTVLLRDINGRPTDGTVMVDVVGPDGPMDVEIKDKGDSTYLAQYPALNKKPGDYVITVMADFQPIAKFRVKAVDGSDKLQVGNVPDATNCFIDGPGIEETRVYVRDFNGHPTDGVVTAELNGPDGERPIEVVEDAQKGNFVLKYAPLNKKEGLYLMQIFVDEEPIAKFNIRAVLDSDRLTISNVADTQYCSVKGVTAEKLTVYIKGSDGEPADGDVTVEITGPDGAPRDTTVTKDCDGAYIVSYDPLNRMLGDYLINILIDRQLIQQLRVRCVEGGLEVKRFADVRKCVLKGPGLEKLTIFVCDRDNKPTKATCMVTLDGPDGSSIPVEVKDDEKEGTYHAVYRPLNEVPGEYIMEVTVDFQTLAKFRINVVDSKLSLVSMADSKRCYIKGPTPEQLTVFLRGYDGQPTDGDCKVGITGPNGQEVEVKTEPECKGTFVATYPALTKQQGEYMMIVYVDGQIVTKFRVKVVGQQFTIVNVVDAKMCFVEPPQVEEIYVHIRGSDGKPADGNCKVTIKGPNGTVTPTVEKQDDGRYRAKYDPLNKTKGDYWIDVEVDQQLVGKFYVRVVEPNTRLRVRYMCDPRRCIIKGPGLEDTTICVLDYNGRPCEVSNHEMKLTGPDGYDPAVKIEQVDMGLYRATYSALNKIAGEYIMEIILDWRTIAKFRIIAEEYSSTLQIIYMAHVKGSDMEAPTSDKLTVYVRGFTGEPADGEVKLQVTGPSGEDVEINEIQNPAKGTYHCRYGPLDTKPGRYLFCIFIDGVQWRKFNMNIKQVGGDGSDDPGPQPKEWGQPAELSQCSVEGPGVDGVNVLIRGADGKPADGNCGAMIVDTEGGQMPCSLRLIGDAKYRLSYGPLNKVGGKYYVAVFVNRKPVGRWCIITTAGSTECTVKTAAWGGTSTIQGLSFNGFKVLALGCDSQPCDSDITVTIEGPNGAVEANVEKQDDLSFAVSYEPLNKCTGEYTIKVILDRNQPMIARMKVG